MKAVIVEIRDKYVAALSKDGRILKIRNDNYTIGQEIEMKKQFINNKRFIKIAATAAASIMLFVAPAWAYLTPYSYVSLDVNPSIEYTVNIFDRVLNVKAVNDDGEEILKEINLDDLKNENIEVAVQKVLNSIIEAGFFEEGEEGGIMIAASSKNDEKSKALTEKLKSKVEEKVKEESTEVEVEAIGVGEEFVRKAKELGVTPGKLNLVQKLQESAENPDDIIVEDWLKKSVKEIMKATKDNSKAVKVENKEADIEEELETNEEKVLDREIKTEEKIESKNDKAPDKVIKTEEKATDKGIKIEEKATDKGIKTEEKTADKGIKTEEKVTDKVIKTEEKAADKEVKTEEKVTDKEIKTEANVTDEEIETEEELESKEEKTTSNETKKEEKTTNKETEKTEKQKGN